MVNLEIGQVWTPAVITGRTKPRTITFVGAYVAFMRGNRRETSSPAAFKQWVRKSNATLESKVSNDPA